MQRLLTTATLVGLLIAAILAAASGKVIYAEVHPAYGKMLEIDHGNGLVSRYAHCSTLLVKEGFFTIPSWWGRSYDVSADGQRFVDKQDLRHERDRGRNSRQSEAPKAV